MKTQVIVNSFLCMAALQMTGGLLNAQISLQNNLVDITGPLQVHLAYTDTSGKSQEFALPQVPSAVAQLIPTLMQQQSTPLLADGGIPNGYFDHLWGTYSRSVCGEIINQMSSLVAGNTKGIYNLNCVPNPQGILQTAIDHQWNDPTTNDPETGTRMVLDYWIPGNFVTFTANASPSDVQYTMIFDVYLILQATTLKSNTMILPPSLVQYGDVLMDSLEEGDQSSALESAFQQFAEQLAQSGPDLDVTGILEAIGQLIAQLIGIESHGTLTDALSSDFSYLRSQSAEVAAAQVFTDFTNLFQALYSSENVGFSQFDAYAGNDHSLVFRMTYPRPAAPVFIGGSSYPKFTVPQIATSASTVAAGHSIGVSGMYFATGAPQELAVGWNQTVVGAPTSRLIWGGVSARPAQLNVVTTTQLSYDTVDLSPSASYQFTVSECDQITCSPQSSTLVLSTSPAGTNAVALSLDNVSNVIARTTANINGTFSAPLTIPAGTTPGAHTLYATLGSQKASAPITVCGATGCAPTLEMISPSTNTVDPPGTIVTTGSAITLAGSNFTAGQKVTLTIDSSTGTAIGTAAVSTSGTFQQNYTMPWVQYGTHEIVATATGVGPTATATFTVTVMNPPQ